MESEAKDISMEEYRKEKIKEFKEKKFYFSFSSLSKLLRDPKQFHKEYIMNEWEVMDDKYLKEGEILHCLVLEPENFDEKFVVMGKVIGGGMKIIIDDLFDIHGKQYLKDNPNQIPTLSNFKKEIINLMVKHDLYQSLTDALRKDKAGNMLTGNDKRLEKAMTQETENYFRVLIEGEKKRIVDIEMVMKTKAKADAILADAKAMKLLTGESQKVDVRKEMKLQTELTGYPFGLKGILDCVKIDYEEETIYISDIKTTSATLKDWIESVEKYLYWLQAIIYKELILSLVPKDNTRPWKLKINFIVVDGKNAVYCFPVSTESLIRWEKRTKGVLDIGKYHYENQSYNLPYEFELGLVEL